jgi:hypothetical protein
VGRDEQFMMAGFPSSMTEDVAANIMTNEQRYEYDQYKKLVQFSKDTLTGRYQIVKSGSTAVSCGPSFLVGQLTLN